MVRFTEVLFSQYVRNKTKENYMIPRVIHLHITNPHFKLTVVRRIYIDKSVKLIQAPIPNIICSFL